MFLSNLFFIKILNIEIVKKIDNVIFQLFTFLLTVIKIIFPWQKKRKNLPKNLRRQYASTADSFDLIFCKFAEEFSLNDYRLLRKTSLAQKLVVTLKVSKTKTFLKNSNLTIINNLEWILFLWIWLSAHTLYKFCFLRQEA